VSVSRILALASAVFLHGCSVEKFYFPIDFSEVEEERASFNITREGDYYFGLVFPHDFEFHSEEERRFFEALSGGVGRKGVPVSLFLEVKKGDKVIFSGTVERSGSDGVIGVALGQEREERTATLRDLKVLKLEKGEYEIEYLNNYAAKELDGIDSYIVVFFYKPKV